MEQAMPVPEILEIEYRVCHNSLCDFFLEISISPSTSKTLLAKGAAHIAAGKLYQAAGRVKAAKYEEESAKIAEIAHLLVGPDLEAATGTILHKKKELELLIYVRA